MSNSGCIIGAETTVRGNITGNEPLVVEGRIEGTVSMSQGVTIEPNGVVEATIDAEELTIRGAVQGDISSSKRVTIHGNAKVVGNITASNVVLEDGARFKGYIDMDVKLPAGLSAPENEEE